ncbi:hypothetical protein I7I53_10909 [Histoplasma capsulatum var. duboisii H88]|uniref:Uncharacterized protein n=1 Tax=Ajellomyces capsulatus (strain H88) TaxID=544711 RepID=A0A8A1LEQ8_AJEC8|nr:hypothetical protein I7I53_10909 [Histoplasma capsulatum var. duboisii H88]
MGTPEEPLYLLTIHATVEEWERWNRQAVMKALLDPAEYKKWRDWKLAFAKRQIERYTAEQRPDMVKGLKEDYLDYVLNRIPPEPVVPPSEPPGLQSIAYYRLELLKPLVNEKWAALYVPNIKAVMEAYRNGSLKVVKGATSYWYNGHMKIAPTREPVNVEEELPKWEAEHGVGTYWSESVSGPVPQLASLSVYPPDPQQVPQDSRTYEQSDMHSVG